MLFLILGGIALWILGMGIFYILDGWFDYGFNNGDEAIFIWATILWPLWIGFFLPGLIAWKAHEALKEKKQKHIEKQEVQQKIRVAAEKELEKIEAELEESLEEECRKTA